MANSFLKYMLCIALIGGLLFIQPADAQKKKAKSPAKTAAAKAPKVDPYELEQKADEAFRDYRFDEAKELQERHIKASKTQENSAFWFLTSCDIGQNMLSRVENIAIIDSITVDSAAVINAIRLSPSSGRFERSEALPAELRKIAPPMFSTAGYFPVNYDPTIYVSESGDMMIWPTTDDNGEYSKMVVSHRLADGSWETPAPLGEAIDNMVGAVWNSVGYPFLMADGTTLYFAADNEYSSLGGWDIFVTRDNGNGFLEPQNVGMPYNSPYNDFMMAIDEVTGAGWWVTDRNQIPGKLTVYVFVPQELRINYPADTPDLIDRAKITRIAGTGATQEHNERVLAAIRNLDNASITPSPAEFSFALPGGKIVSRMSEFKNPASQTAMRRYLEGRDRLISDQERLASLRASSQANSSKRAEILELERSIPQLREQDKQLANDVVRTETGK